MCTKRVQLKVGLINKSLMGVHAHYRNICHLQQFLCTAKHSVLAKCVLEFEDEDDDIMSLAGETITETVTPGFWEEI